MFGLHVKYKPDSLSSWFIRLNLGWAKLTNKLGVYIFFLKYSTYCTNSLSDYRYRIWMWMASKSLKYINHETKCNKLIGLSFLWSQFFFIFYILLLNYIFYLFKVHIVPNSMFQRISFLACQPIWKELMHDNLHWFIVF